VRDCYTVLGIIHTRYKPLKGKIKDYIAQPKPNCYQSLHTTVFCEDGEIVEIQIRDKRMHEIAEYGIAAHWYYDEQGKPSYVKIAPKKLSWINELIKWQEEIKDEKTYLETLKIDIFKDQIFVFTPKGDVIELPDGATPVDFAYQIHTEIGDKVSLAYVNDQIVSLDTPLKNGDVVRIVIDKNRKGPNIDWIKFVKTNFARNRIKKYSLKKNASPTANS